MSDVAAKETHYMTFPHTVTGSTRGDWTFNLIKNGEVVLDTQIEIVELDNMVYTASFDNDGEDEANWTLIATDSNDDSRTYIETWRAKKKTVEKNVSQIRASLEGEGGFFGNNTDKKP